MTSKTKEYEETIIIKKKKITTSRTRLAGRVEIGEVAEPAGSLNSVSKILDEKGFVLLHHPPYQLPSNFPHLFHKLTPNCVIINRVIYYLYIQYTYAIQFN